MKKQVLIFISIFIFATLICGATSAADLNSSTEEKINFYVPSTSENGVSFKAPYNSTYNFNITGGAFSPWGTDPWVSIVNIYKNREVTYEPDPNNKPQYKPTQPDYAIGIWSPSSYSEAESAAQGSNINIYLKKDEYVILLCPDHRGWYAGNSGGMSLSISYLLPVSDVNITKISNRFIDIGSSDSARNSAKIYYNVSNLNFPGKIIPVVQSKSGKIISSLPAFTAKSSGYFTWNGKINGKYVNPNDNYYNIKIFLTDSANKLISYSGKYSITVQPSLRLSLKYYPTSVWMPSPGKKTLPKIYYRIGVKNTSPYTIYNVKVSDQHSYYLKRLNYATTLYNWKPWTGSYTIPSLGPGKTKYIYLFGVVEPIKDGKYVAIDRIKFNAGISCESRKYYNSINNLIVTTTVKWPKAPTPADQITLPNLKPTSTPDDWDPIDDDPYDNKIDDPLLLIFYLIDPEMPKYLATSTPGIIYH